ncbi:DUF3130 family protein [Carnobacterium gallinarum]|uniref:DUF3130 family protein n=1 Tax=Carnobacterium gallinarum TaxID=2749 RepID=UPI0005542F19|nr:DUF3130 family protein [Carnobacterium gallinarum]
MLTVETNTTQADKHAAAIQKSVKDAKFPKKESPTITYSDGRSVLQAQECMATFSALLSTLKSSVNTDCDHIKEINQTFVDKNETLEKGLIKIG